MSGVIAEDHARQLKAVEETRKLLETERRAAEDDLKTKEAAVSSFLTEHPQLAGEVGAATSGGLIRAADRDRAGQLGGGDVAGLELQAAQLEEQLAATGQRPPPVNGVAAPDPVLLAAAERAQTELQAAERDLTDKQAHLTNEHPDVKMALRRVSVAEAASRRAQAALAASRVPTPAPVAVPAALPDDARTAALKRALAAVRQQIAAAHTRAAPRVEAPKGGPSMVAIDTQWIRLNRDAAEARDRATQLQTKQFQADLASSVTSAGEGGRLVVADRPFKPLRPSAGGRGKIVALGSAVSILFALLTMVVLAMFDDHLYAAPDIQRVLDDGFVVVIPSSPRKMLPKPVEVPDVGGAESGTASG